MRNTCPEARIRAVSVEVHQVLLNLCLNAIQAMPDGGELTVSAGLYAVERHRSGDELAEGSYVRIDISDTGKGIPSGLMEFIFDPFFTTKDHGTGLGLPIVNTIITSHNGKLLLTNPEEGGAMITILLPVASEPDIGDTPEKDERPAASADDEPVTLTDPLPSEKHDLREGDASPQTR